MARNRAARGGRTRGGSGRPAAKPRREPARQAPAAPDPLPPFRLGAVPGATPGKWIARWREQRPHQRLELVAVEAADQRETLATGAVDALIGRGPVDDPDLHVVALYDEIPVVVMAAESHLTAADELEPRDLEGEVLLTPGDDVLGPLELPTTPGAVPIATTEDAIATAAAGVGIVVVPMSLARLHHRRDAAFRPLAAGAPISPVVLAWRRDRDGEDTQAFVAITRGRTSRSSR